MEKKIFKSPFFLKYHRLISNLSNFKIDNYPLAWKKIYFKEYPRFPQYSLPLLKNLSLETNLFKILQKRRSRRVSDKNSLIQLDKISYLLYFSAGINDLDIKNRISKRMYPSGGARYPLEIYLIIFKRIEKLNPGIYHYNVKNHSLELILTKIAVKKVKNTLPAVNKNLIYKNSLLLIITAVYGRTYIKYGELTYKLCLLEAGHLGQNILLLAESLNLNCCSIGYISEKKIASLIDIDLDKEIILYSLIINPKKTIKKQFKKIQ